MIQKTRNIKQEVYIIQIGISPTLTTMDKGGHKQPYILVREATKKGYTEAMEGDSINVSYPNSTTKRGRVGKEVSQTILTSSSMATVIETPKPICLNNRFKQPSVQDRIYDSEGIATAVTASQFRPKVAERKMFNPYNEKEIIAIDKKYNPNMYEVIDFEGKWLKIKAKINGKKYEGWIPPEEQCCNVYSTCN